MPSADETPQDAPSPLEPAAQPSGAPRTLGVWPTASSRGPRLLLWAALLLTALPGAYMLGRPFGPGSFDGWLGGWYGVIARNLAHQGFWTLRFTPYSVPDAPAFGAYLHHPVTMANVWGGFVWLFGDHEWALRLPSVLAALLSIVLCAKLGARVLGAWGGTLTALLVASTPMFGIYSSQVHYEPFVLAASAGTYLLYLRYLEAPSGRRLAALAGGLALAVGIGWFGALIAVPIALHLLRARGRKAAGPIALLFLTSCAVVGLHLLHARWVDPGAVDELFRAVAHRAGSRQDDASTTTFGWAAYLARHGTFAWRLYGPGALWLILAAAGVALGWRRRREESVHALLLLLPGLLVVTLFRQASFQHGFLSFPLVLGTGLGGALFLRSVGDRASGGGRRLWPALALGLGVAAVGAGQWQLWRELRTFVAGTDQAVPRRIGLEIRDLVAPGETVAAPAGRLFSHVWVPAQYYADRPIFWDLETLAAIDRARADGSRGNLRYVAFFAETLEAAAGIARALDRRGARKVWKEGGEVLLFDLERTVGRPGPPRGAPPR